MNADPILFSKDFETWQVKYLFKESQQICLFKEPLSEHGRKSPKLIGKLWLQESSSASCQVKTALGDRPGQIRLRSCATVLNIKYTTHRTDSVHICNHNHKHKHICYYVYKLKYIIRLCIYSCICMCVCLLLPFL